MLIPTGSGRFERRSTTPPSFLLYNFDIDGDRVKMEHATAITSQVVPLLSIPETQVTVVGLASRTASDAHNRALSLRRAENVVACLRSGGRSHATFQQTQAYGESRSRLEGDRDGTEIARFRSVVIFVAKGQRYEPPPVIDVTPPTPGIEMPGDGLMDTVGSIADIVGFVGEFGAIFATGGVLVVLEVLGGPAGVLSVALSLPAGWMAGERLAEFNGKMQGFWNAMQDMANPYALVDNKTPERLWPDIQRPEPRPMPVQNPEFDHAWRNGERQGANIAYQEVVRLEGHPRRISVGRRGGTRIRIRMTGRMYLALLVRAFPGPNGVRYAIRDEFNQYLRSHGRSAWPLTR